MYVTFTNADTLEHSLHDQLSTDCFGQWVIAAYVE